MTDKVNDELALARLEHEWMEAVRRQDLAACEPIVAQDFRMWPGDLSNLEGTSREQWFANARHWLPESFSVDLLQVHVYGDVAVVQSRWTQRATVQGRELNGTWPLTDIWVRRDGRWQVTVRYTYRPDILAQTTAQ